MTDLGTQVTVDFYKEAQYELLRDSLEFWVDEAWKSDDSIFAEDKAYIKRTTEDLGEQVHKIQKLMVGKFKEVSHTGSSNVRL